MVDEMDNQRHQNFQQRQNVCLDSQKLSLLFKKRKGTSKGVFFVVGFFLICLTFSGHDSFGFVQCGTHFCCSGRFDCYWRWMAVGKRFFSRSVSFLAFSPAQTKMFVSSLRRKRKMHVGIPLD
jgi:hypothetical protein